MNERNTSEMHLGKTSSWRGWADNVYAVLMLAAAPQQSSTRFWRRQVRSLWRVSPSMFFCFWLRSLPQAQVYNAFSTSLLSKTVRP